MVENDWRVKRPTNEEILKQTTEEVLEVAVRLRNENWSYAKITAYLHTNKYPCPYKRWTVMTLTGILKAYGHKRRWVKTYRHHEHADYVRELRASGMTYGAIAKQLNAEGKTNVQGNVFSEYSARMYVIYDEALRERYGDDYRPYEEEEEL